MKIIATSCEKWLLEGVLQKRFPRKVCKIHIEIPVLNSLFNNVTVLQAVRLTTLLKRDPGTSISKPAV